MMKKYLVQTPSFIRLINHRKIRNNLSIIRVLIYMYNGTRSNIILIRLTLRILVSTYIKNNNFSQFLIQFLNS